MNIFANYLTYQLDQLLKPAREALAVLEDLEAEIKPLLPHGGYDETHYEHDLARDRYIAVLIDIAAKTNLRLSDIDRYLREEQHGDS